MRRSPAPFWFVLLLAVLEACAWRYLASIETLSSVGGPDAAPPALAFWGILVGIASAIWQGLQVAGQITLQVLQYALVALQWSVKALWAFATTAANAVAAVGKLLLAGLRKVWDFMRHTYDAVLKPAWTKFWKFVEWAKRSLEKLFAPVIKLLQRIRAEILEFYDKWVRPVLDVIGVARKALRVLASLGLDWARALDRKLGELEEKIDAPFRFALSKLNEVINLVNRVVTANGLFQRLALIRSVERDLKFLERAFVNWRSKPLTAADYESRQKRASERTLEDVRNDIEEAVLTGGGRYGVLIQEMQQQWRIHLQNAERGSR